MTIAAQECVGVYMVMGRQKDRPYLSWTDHFLKLKWIQKGSHVEAISPKSSHVCSAKSAAMGQIWHRGF